MKLSDVYPDDVMFGLRVLSAEYEYTGVWGVITKVYKDWNSNLWIRIHWSNGNHSFFRQKQYSAVRLSAI